MKTISPALVEFLGLLQNRTLIAYFKHHPNGDFINVHLPSPELVLRAASLYGKMHPNAKYGIIRDHTLMNELVTSTSSPLEVSQLEKLATRGFQINTSAAVKMFAGEYLGNVLKKRVFIFDHSLPKENLKQQLEKSEQEFDDILASLAIKKDLN